MHDAASTSIGPLANHPMALHHCRQLDSEPAGLVKVPFADHMVVTCCRVEVVDIEIRSNIKSILTHGEVNRRGAVMCVTTDTVKYMA